jgi:hypothetical protein
MTITRAAAALLLALLLTGCGDDDGGDEPSEAVSSATAEGPDLTSQAETVLACTTERGLPGEIAESDEGFPALDLTTEHETIVVQLLPSVEEAAAYQNPADLEQEQVDNAVIVGGAISPEHHTAIVECLTGA